jgi:hypothetical protein
VIDLTALKKFIKFGFDSELGWVRKPGTNKTEIGKTGMMTYFNIDKNGSRVNPGHEHLSSDRVVIYGDSFGFSRQVNDNETIQFYLSEILQTNVMNFAVGNYGLDQILLRFKRMHTAFPARITIFCFVPSTIVRIHSIWKHYNEFGNVFGFKPRYIFDDNHLLAYLPNPASSEENIVAYQILLPQIKKYDPFYRRKFLKEIIRFPWLFHIFAQPRRNISLIYLVAKSVLNKTETSNKNVPYPAAMKEIMRINLSLRSNLFRERDSLELLEGLILQISDECKKANTLPLYVLLPQKDDILFLLKNGVSYYKHWVNWAKMSGLPFIDLTDNIINEADIHALYCDDTDYGGHFSAKGNSLVAGIIADAITTL